MIGPMMGYFKLRNIMLTTGLRYKISLESIKNIFGRKRNIIIHHGLMGSSKNFRSLSKAPSFSNYVNSYLIDARNHGSSPHTPTHTVKDLADDLYQYILTNKLNNQQQKLTLMGHSMGGLALMEFTKHYNSQQIQKFIDRVIIIDIPATPLSSRPSYIKMGLMLKSLLQIDMTKPIQTINREIDERSLTPDIAALLKSNIIKVSDSLHRWSVNLPVLVSGYNHIGNFNLGKDNPKAWRVPVDLIYGQLSGNFDQAEEDVFKKNYGEMKDDNFHKVDGAGHWVHFQRTQAFLEIVKRLLEKDEVKR